MNATQKIIRLVAFLLIPFLLGFYSNNLFLKKEIIEPAEPKANLEKKASPNFLVLQGEKLSLKSNILSTIDINKDGKDEIINHVKTASWTDSVYILTPNEDGTFNLFCEHCHFFYHAGNKGMEFLDLNNDNVLDVKLWLELDSKEPELFYFLDGDYIKIDKTPIETLNPSPVYTPISFPTYMPTSSFTPIPTHILTPTINYEKLNRCQKLKSEYNLCQGTYNADSIRYLSCRSGGSIQSFCIAPINYCHFPPKECL